MMHMIRIAGWIFEFGLFGLLLATLTYARRLDHSIVRMRANGAELQELIEQIGTSINAAISATERLKEQAGASAIALDEACQTAAVSARRLDELISQATLILDRPSLPTRQAPDLRSATAPAVSTAEPGTNAVGRSASRARVVRKSSSKVRAVASRYSDKPQSRAERDLARMLLDAS